MKVQTLSVIVGKKACNAKCPYCVARMTPSLNFDECEKINWRNFDKANKFARQNDVSTVLLTGKGEPTLYPDEITDYLDHLEKHDYPFIELQTNGIALSQNYEKYESYLKEWYDKGLTTISLSIVHYDPEANRQIFLPHEKEYINLPDLIDKLHSKGYSVRLSCVMFKGGIDTPKGLEELLGFAQKNSVEQLTVRSVTRPEDSSDAEVSEWVKTHELSIEDQTKMKEYLDKEGSVLMDLCHGAVVYDVKGQNICLTNALTISPTDEKIRQLIFFPDGHLRYDWRYKGAVLL